MPDTPESHPDQRLLPARQHAGNWAAIFDTFPYPVDVTDEFNCIVYINPAFQEVYGYDLRAIAELPPHFLLPPQFPESTLRSRLKQLSSTGAPWSGVQENITASGRRFQTFLVALPLKPEKRMEPSGYIYAGSPPEESDIMQVRFTQVILQHVLVLRNMLDGSSLPDPPARHGSRQRTILRLKALGYSSKRIAGLLQISENTVRTVLWRSRRSAGRPPRGREA